MSRKETLRPPLPSLMKESGNGLQKDADMSTHPDSVLDGGKRALVTGASGFLATEIILLLLERGYKVVAAMRSQQKVDSWKRLYPHLTAEQIRYTIVEDMQVEGAYDAACEGMDIIFHTASPFHFKFKDNEKDMLVPAREGAISVLKSASKEPKIRKVVFTSSFAAVTNPRLDPRPGWIYTENDWNPVTWEEAVASDDPHYVYLASKTFAEKAVMEFHATHKPGFSISVIVPPIILGRARQPFGSMADINQSSRVLHRLLDAPAIPHTPAYVCVDVKDCAKCHVLAGEQCTTENKRYLTVGSEFSQTKAAKVIARLFPSIVERLPPRSSEGSEESHYLYSSRLVEDELGIQWTPFEQTVRETFKQLLDIERIGFQ